MQSFSPLFQSYTLNNGVTLKNRLVVAPITHYASNPDGSLSDEERTFLQGRAQGFSMFIAAATLVSEEGKAFVGQPYAISDQDLPSLKARAEMYHAQGAKAILQIHHGGKNITQAQADADPNQDVVAPSADPAMFNARELSVAEIEQLIQAFANATDLALSAGYDGVEIHGANGYLIQQFSSAASNQRTDEWGGSLEKRLRFPLAIVDAVNAVRTKHQRPDFIVGYRLSPEEPGEQGLTMTDTFALIDALKTKPLQYLHISLWDFYKKARRGADTNLTRLQLIHQRVNGAFPVIGVGNLLSADAMLNALNTGWAEFIALGKAVLLNPHNLVELIENGQADQITTRFDPERADHYGYPEGLWQQNLMGLAYLPPVKGKDWQPVDI